MIVTCNSCYVLVKVKLRMQHQKFITKKKKRKNLDIFLSFRYCVYEKKSVEMYRVNNDTFVR